jgi:protein SCO1/2
MPIFVRMPTQIAVLLILTLLALPTLVLAHQDGDGKGLPVIGPAPQFALTSQDGQPMALAAFRGKVVAVTLLYTGCPDICPLLTEKMAQVRDELGTNFGAKIVFVSITLDPEHDTTEVLKQYAQLFERSRRMGLPDRTAEAIVTWRTAMGILLTEPGRLDRSYPAHDAGGSDGQIRVQYLGARFDPESSGTTS